MPYQYVTSLRKYRDTETGKFVAQSVVLDYVERFVDAGAASTDSLTDLYIDGSLSAGDYINALKAEYKTTVMQEYMLGRGGREAMTSRDWGTTGGLISKQHAYMNGFQGELEAGNLSEAQIRARSRLYFDAAGEAYERGNAAANGVFSLPAYPRDSTSECMNGCKCHWRFAPLELPGDTDCYWEVNPLAENCETCLSRGIAWYPLRIRSGILQPYVDIRKGIG